MTYTDLRKGRYSENGRIYFVTATTYQREPYFKSLDTTRNLIRSMKLIETELDIRFICWVIMPDHAHWLIELRNFHTLSNVVNSIKGVSAFKINKSLNRNGKFWQPSFYDRALRKEEDLKVVARYIVANPLRAGLVSRIEDYPHWDSIWI